KSATDYTDSSRSTLSVKSVARFFLNQLSSLVLECVLDDPSRVRFTARNGFGEFQRLLCLYFSGQRRSIRIDDRFQNRGSWRIEKLLHGASRVLRTVQME